MLQKKIAEIVTRLKRVREEEGLSYQRIYDIVEENGDHVSLTTIKRVFEDGSESFGYQYESTLKPIADAVLGVYGPSEAASADEADALKAIIDYKSEKIADLAAQLERTEDSYRRRTEFLREQIALKDARIDRLHGIIERMVDALLPETGGGAAHVRATESGACGGADLSAKEPDGRPGVVGLGDAVEA